MVVLSHLNLIRLDNVDSGSLQTFKTICDNLVTTPEGFRGLAGYLAQLLNSNQPSPILDNLEKYTAVAYSALAPKVATDDEMFAVNMIHRLMTFSSFLILKCVFT